MPNFPIIDTHLHIWDMERLNYSAFEGHPLFGKSYHIEDFQKDCEDLEIEAMVFVECFADFTKKGGQYIDEIKFVEDSAQKDPRIKGITILKVELSSDMKKSYIYFSSDNSFNDLGIEEILEGLEKAKGYIRKKLSHNLNLRRTPEIFFKKESYTSL